MLQWFQYFFSLYFMPLLYLTSLNPSEIYEVHLVPHTHNDVGWVKPSWEYYNSSAELSVKAILISVIDALQKNTSRRFSYVEQFYFSAYWNEQPQEKKQIIKKLIENGQLELLHGGYVMNDEACTYYDDIIEQMTLGHRFIKNTFNQTTNVAWHLDPFGHSAPQARLFSEMGFDIWFFERISYPDFDQRKVNGQLEMIWRPESYNRNKNFLLAHVNYLKYYLAPFDGCVTILCNLGKTPDERKVKITEAAGKYAKWIREQVDGYSPTGHIFHQVGGDFEWGMAKNYYERMEVLIDFFEKNPGYGIKAHFSTPSQYTKAVYKEIVAKNISLTEKVDDFFPYRDTPNAFWTGFYTSKPLLKKMVREASTYLQGVKKLLSILYLKQNLTFSAMDQRLFEFEKAVAMVQHHDAVTGTANVRSDQEYDWSLWKAYNSIHEKLMPVLATIFKEEYSETDPQPFWLSMSIYSAYDTKAVKIRRGQQDQHVIAYVYNPSQIQTQVIKLEVPYSAGTLKTNLGNTEIDYTRQCYNQSFCEICFVDQIGTNQLKSYIWYNKNNNLIDDKYSPNTHELPLTKDADIVIHLFNNEKLVIKESSSADFEYITEDGVSHPFSLHYGYYQSYQRKNRDDPQQASGAYIFRAVTQNLMRYGSIPQEVLIKEDKQVIEVRIQRENLVTTKLRFYNISKDENGDHPLQSHTIEIETMVETIPVGPLGDGIGKEIVLLINGTGIENEGVFYTNSNGLENQKRIRNSVIRVNESVAGNYYPVNSAIYIEDRKTGARVTLMNDRSQGGSSVRDGAIELMINRRTVQDDERGVGEPLYDKRPVQVTHWLMFSKGSLKQRSLQYYLDTRPLVYLSKTVLPPQPQAPLSPTFPSPLEKSYTSTIGFVKFYIRIYSEDEMLVRLHNLREDQAVEVSNFWNKKEGTCRVLQEELLGQQKLVIKITDVKEVTLTTVREKNEMLKQKFRWDWDRNGSLVDTNSQNGSSIENVVLNPLEERAFMLKYSV